MQRRIRCSQWEKLTAIPSLSVPPILCPQLGAPANREQYIHRAGRTGRAGRAGQCTLLLADFELPFLDKLKDLPIRKLEPMRGPLSSGGRALPATLLADPIGTLTRVSARVEYSCRARAYQSFLGYYKSHEVLK